MTPPKWKPVEIETTMEVDGEDVELTCEVSLCEYGASVFDSSVRSDNGDPVTISWEQEGDVVALAIEWVEGCPGFWDSED